MSFISHSWMEADFPRWEHVSRSSTLKSWRFLLFFFLIRRAAGWTRAMVETIEIVLSSCYHFYFSCRPPPLLIFVFLLLLFSGFVGSTIGFGYFGIGRSQPHERQPNHGIGRRNADRLGTANRRSPNQRFRKCFWQSSFPSPPPPAIRHFVINNPSLCTPSNQWKQMMDLIRA